MLDVRVDGLALDRPGPDERDLDGQVGQALRPRLEQALHLRAALDLEDADGVGGLDLLVDALVVEGHAREVDRLAAEARDLVDGILDGRQHPEPEQVDLEEAGVGAGVLVPLAHLPALHRRRLHRHELDERPRGDDHPARVLGDVARQAADLGAEGAEGAPARRAELRRRVRQGGDLVGDALRVPAVRQPGEPLEVGVREAERLADVPDRAARAVGREARDERCVLPAVALGDGDDQLLADVAREVEVDVRHGVQLAVQEAPEREIRLHRIDVREAGQIADDRPDRAAPAAPGRQDVPGDRPAPHLERHLASQLEHLPVEEEETGEPELLDQGELFVEAGTGGLFVAVESGVAFDERAVADAAQLHDRGLLAVGEVGVAVAELLGEVELEPAGELERARDRVGIVREPLGRLGRRDENALVVPAPLALAALERGSVADRDEDVLERRPALGMRMRVARRDGGDAERGREVAQRGVPARVAALVRALELDEEPIAPERAGGTGGLVRIPVREAVARAAGEGDEPIRVLEQEVEVERGRKRSIGLVARRPRPRVRGREKPTEIRVALRRLDEERQVRPVGERHLRAGDRADAERLRSVRELERPVDPVVVGERERLVAELGRPRRELFRQRRPVEKRVGRVRVELDVRQNRPLPTEEER